MTSVVITMLVIVAIALLALAVVAVGMRGKFSETAPGVADRLGLLGTHLNGEADMPEGMRQFLVNGQQQVRRVAHRG